MQAGAGSDKEMEMSEIIRLDKYLADMGCGTRSQVKQMIRKGQVEINGEKIKKPEQKITTAQDRVRVQIPIFRCLPDVSLLPRKIQAQSCSFSSFL